MHMHCTVESSGGESQAATCRGKSVTSALFHAGEVNEDAVSYCERFLELVTDLEAQLPTRRFFNTLLNDSHLVVGSALIIVILALCIWLSPPLLPSAPPPPSVPRSAATCPVLPAGSQRDTYSNRYGIHLVTLTPSPSPSPSIPPSVLPPSLSLSSPHPSLCPPSIPLSVLPPSLPLSSLHPSL